MPIEQVRGRSGCEQIVEGCFNRLLVFLIGVYLVAPMMGVKSSENARYRVRRERIELIEMLRFSGQTEENQ